MADEQTKQYDVDGYDIVTEKILTLLNDFPALSNTDRIEFATLAENRGKAMFPLNGGVVESNVKDITGYTTQVCMYPFLVMYRAGNLTAERRAAVKEWLDNLGRWLEKQTVHLKVGSEVQAYTLAEYPELSGERKFKIIQRTAPAYLDGVNDNLTEDWAIALSAKYTNEF